MFEFDLDDPNVVPSRYREVALSINLESLDSSWLERHFVGKEAYMRTRFIVARCGKEMALVEVDRPESSNLFSPIESVRVVAKPSQCRYVISSDVDVGVTSQMAMVAMDHQDVSCVIIEGRYSHVSFILNPNPLKLHVLDIVPPFPSKLLDQIQRVLEDAEDLPPIVVNSTMIDSREQLKKDCNPLPSHLLVPCRGSGIDIEKVSISYLDERPEFADWKLLGCERSNQIHHWFYGSSPTIIDTCPKRYIGSIDNDEGHILTRCCLLQEGIEDKKKATFVPWGSTLLEVRRAIEVIVNRVGVSWTRI